jgi:transposase-like protein
MTPRRPWNGSGANRPASYLFVPFDREAVVLCVRWYLRFKLSYRDLVAERGGSPRTLSALTHLIQRMAGIRWRM